MIEKIIEIGQKYIGKTPKDMDCLNWTDLHEKLEIEMRELVKNNSPLPVVARSFITSMAEKFDVEPSKIVIGMQYGTLVVQKYDEGAADKWETLAMIDPNCE